MPDNVAITPGSGVNVASREVTYSGDVVEAPAVGLLTFAGADDAKTVTDVPGGGGVEANALRVTIASDSTGLVSVDDNGGSLTVDAAGDVAHDAIDSGNPLKIGGKAKGSVPTAVADGDRVNAYFSIIGAFEQGGYGRGPTDANTVEVVPWAHDSANVGPWATAPKYFNGATLDLARANVEATLLASAARTAETNSADQTNFNGRGAHIVIDVTLDPAAASITPVIEGKDALTGQYYEILRGAAITAVGTTVLKVYPGLTAAANAVANDILPRTWRLQMEVASADSMTYSASASTIL